MTPISIKALIAKKGWRHIDVLEKLTELGVRCTKSELSQVVNGHRINLHIRIGVAHLLEKPVHKIFDAKFDAAVALKKSRALNKAA